jgi:hypothetical protein
VPVTPPPLPIAPPDPTGPPVPAGPPVDPPAEPPVVAGPPVDPPEPEPTPTEVPVPAVLLLDELVDGVAPPAVLLLVVAEPLPPPVAGGLPVPAGSDAHAAENNAKNESWKRMSLHILMHAVGHFGEQISSKGLLGPGGASDATPGAPEDASARFPATDDCNGKVIEVSDLRLTRTAHRAS